MKREHTQMMTSGPITRQLIRFSVPLVLGNLFQLSYNMVDTIVVGRFTGSAGLAATGTCDQIMSLLILGVSGVCIGASVLMGNFFGAKDREQLLAEMKTTVSLGLIFAALIMAAGIPMTGAVLHLMRIQPEAMQDGLTYLRIIFLGLPFMCLYNTYAAALRSVGDSDTPVRYLVLSCVINICMDLLLVAGFRLGVAGAAIATVLAQGISAMMCIRHVSRHVPELRFSWRTLRMDRDLAVRTLSYGGLTALQQCSQPIGNIIIQSSVNTLGVTAAAAFSAVRKIEDIGLLPGRSISSGITAFTAQNEGAELHDRTREGFRKAMGLELGCGLLVSAFVLLLRQPLMALFTTNGEIILAGLDYFRLIGFCYWLPCLTNGYQGYFRGIGRMGTTLLATLTQISARVGVTLLTVPAIGLPGAGLACVAGWSLMILWQIPWQIHCSRRLRD